VEPTKLGSVCQVYPLAAKFPILLLPLAAMLTFEKDFSFKNSFLSYFFVLADKLVYDLQQNCKNTYFLV